MSYFRYCFLFIILASEVFAQEAPLPATTVVANATELARKENKKVLLMFGASWCSWCKRMDASILDSTCADFFERNYVVTHLDVQEREGKEHLENPGGMELYRSFGGEDGVPYWVVLNADGSLLKDSRMDYGDGKLQNVGCPASEQEVTHLILILKETSDISEDEEKLVFRRFRMNDPRYEETKR